MGVKTWPGLKPTSRSVVHVVEQIIRTNMTDGEMVRFRDGWEPPFPAEMLREPIRWERTQAEHVVAGSRAQAIFCIRDAQHDIAELWREVLEWRAGYVG